MDNLSRLGWNEHWSALWTEVATPGSEPGRVILEHNHVFRVATPGGEVLAESSGRLKHKAEGRHELPAVGDWVAVRSDPARSRMLIRAVLPRRTTFSRKAAGRETEQQVVAANVDTVFAVFGLDHPVNARSIERYLTVAERSGATPFVVLNKADLAGDLEAARAEATAAAGRVPVLVVSARRPDGVGPIEAHLEAGRTIALIGPSGAGKSSLVNRLVRQDVVPTGEVRDADAKGRHTSVHRQLVIGAGGALIIDTPGMRELQLWEGDTAVEQAFEDVLAFSAGCRFRNCRHEHEPGCAVKAAAADGRLAPERLDSYLKLIREQDAVDVLREERAQLEDKRRARVMGKALKAMQKDRGR